MDVSMYPSNLSTYILEIGCRRLVPQEVVQFRFSAILAQKRKPTLHRS